MEPPGDALGDAPDGEWADASDNFGLPPLGGEAGDELGRLDPLKWAERVAANRKAGLILIRSSPEPLMLIVRIVLGPLDRLRVRQ